MNSLSSRTRAAHHPFHPLAAPLAALGVAFAMPACGSEDGDRATDAVAGYDIQYQDAGIFLPQKPTRSDCQPCNSSMQCNGNADVGAKCVDFGDDGAFCGGACSTDADCTEGHQCSDVKSVEGDASKQCTPKPTGSAAKGVCSCSDWAAATSKSTQCIKSFPLNAAENVYCPGVRYCTVNGLTECQATGPSDEVCDGLDNDCDGQTDEGTCKDAPDCQVGVCHLALGCQYEQALGKCDDGNKCTKDDACFDGKCKGVAIECDDTNPCTTDACQPGVGCVSTNIDGVPCDDGALCTLNDSCKGGACQAGVPKSCDDSNACTLDLCHKASGDCINSPTTDACDDGDICTVGDACKDGACAAGAPKSCDDNLPCTTDSCKAGVGCVSLPAGVTACD